MMLGAVTDLSILTRLLACFDWLILRLFIRTCVNFYFFVSFFLTLSFLYNICVVHVVVDNVFKRAGHHLERNDEAALCLVEFGARLGLVHGIGQIEIQLVLGILGLQAQAPLVDVQVDIVARLAQRQLDGDHKLVGTRAPDTPHVAVGRLELVGKVLDVGEAAMHHLVVGFRIIRLWFTCSGCLKKKQNNIKLTTILFLLLGIFFFLKKSQLSHYYFLMRNSKFDDK